MASIQDNTIQFHQGAWENLPDPESIELDCIAYDKDNKDLPFKVKYLRHTQGIHAFLIEIVSVEGPMKEINIPEGNFTWYRVVKEQIEESVRDHYDRMVELEFLHLVYRKSDF